MTFKANLLRKLEIDSLADRVVRSIGPPDSGRRIEKDPMQRLLEIGEFRYSRVRDLDLYYLVEEAPDSGEILVLDNDLPIYHTSAADVAMRKSPTVKEMISVRNAIKILKDADVVVSKKEESVRTVQGRLIERLDLSFTSADVAEIVDDGIRSLEREFSDGVVESLTLLAVLLDYRPAPKPLRISLHEVFGETATGVGGEARFGPIVIYSHVHNTLRLVAEPVDLRDTLAVEAVHRVAQGQEKADREDAEVFAFLRKGVEERHLSGTPRAQL